MVPRKGALLTDPASLPPWITESDIDVYVAEFTRSGFRGPLAWWRNIDRGWELMAPFAGAAVTVPALYMAGDRGCYRRRFLPGHREAVGTGPQAPAGDHAAGLRSLDPAGTCARGRAPP